MNQDSSEVRSRRSELVWSGTRPRWLRSVLRSGRAVGRIRIGRAALLLLLADSVVDQVQARQGPESNNQRRSLHERGEIDGFRFGKANGAGRYFNRLAGGQNTRLLASVCKRDAGGAFENGKPTAAVSAGFQDDRGAGDRNRDRSGAEGRAPGIFRDSQQG
jgi:hypothetical protein